jgi:hypothetical protein
MTTLTPPLTTGTRLWNNRRHKIYCIAGRVSPCGSDDWEVLYFEDGVVDPTDDFRRRPENEFFELNRDGLPRFVVLPPGPELWVDYTRGYCIGLVLSDCDDLPKGLPNFICAVRLGMKHRKFADEFLRDYKTEP